jgi:hypothetical protein
MKAHEGEEIVCKCSQPAGDFRRDVEDHGTISFEDIAITLPGGAHHDPGFVWVCPMCNATVAQRFSDGHWGVNTKKGWRE